MNCASYFFLYALEVFGEIPEPQYLSFLLIVFYRTERLSTIFMFIPQGTNFIIVIAFDIYSSMMQMSRAWMYGDRPLSLTEKACVLFALRPRRTSSGMAL